MLCVCGYGSFGTVLYVQSAHGFLFFHLFLSFAMWWNDVDLAVRLNVADSRTRDDIVLRFVHYGLVWMPIALSLRIFFMTLANRINVVGYYGFR